MVPASSSAYALVRSSFAVLLASFTSSKIAETASAVLKSSSIAVSNFATSSSTFFLFSCSASVSASPDTLLRRSFKRSAQVMMRSSPFLEASISSALKLIGLR